MYPSALMTAAMTAMMAQAKPDTVVLTTSPIITRPALTSSRTLAIYEVSMAVRAHLASRMKETWDLEVESTPPIDPTAATFYVHLDWPTQNEVIVGVADRDVTLAERSLDVEDSETTGVMAWLLIRSSVERALLQPTHPVPVADATPDIPSVPEPPAEPEAPAIAPEPTPAPETPTVAQTTAPPVAPYKPKDWSLSLNALTHTGSNGFSAVPSVGLRYRVGKWFNVGIEATFRHEERANGEVNVYHVPLTGFVGARPWERSFPIEIGLATTFDPKFVSLPSNGGATASFLFGPYTRYRWAFFSFGKSEFALVGDAALQFNLRRVKYVVRGTEFTDSVADFRLSGGVEWAWQ